MSCGWSWNERFRPHRPAPEVVASAPRIANCSRDALRAVDGLSVAGPAAPEFGPWQTVTTALPSGARGFSSACGRGVSIFTMANTASTGHGSPPTGPLSGRLRGKKSRPNPTDRAKPGYKEHLLVDGRGVPLSTVSTAANVNDGPMLSLVLNSLPIVRPQPEREQPHHLCLDAAFDNAPTRKVLLLQRYTGHIAPKGGQAEDAVVHPGGQARRWKVERTRLA